MRSWLFALMVALAPVQAWADTCPIKVGGATGDYNLHFAPALGDVLKRKVWCEPAMQTGAGTPESMEWLLQNPNGVALLQGNVYAELIQDPKYQGKIAIARADVAREAVVAVLSKRMQELTNGNFAVIAQRANRVRLITSSEQSGPGVTLKQLMRLDPNGLAKAKSVTFAPNMDEAIAKVAADEADVAIMVQFPNLDNPRFQAISKAGLSIQPILYRSMRELEIPSVGKAFEICERVQVERGGWFGGADRFIDTACTPMLYGVPAGGDPDIAKAVAEAPLTGLLPKDQGFRKMVETIKTQVGVAYDKTLDTVTSTARELSTKWQ